MPIRKRKINKKKVYRALLIIGVILAVFLIFEFAKYLPTLFELMFQKDITLKKTEQNRINVLILGIGGGKHDGPNLTDTIIMANIDPETKRVTLISVPRDLWVEDLKAKINTAYASGESKRKGGGLELTKAVVGKVLGQDIEYGLRVDFNGFIKAVDMVGGIDVFVERSFEDPEYPLSGKENDTCGHSEEELQELATASSQLEAFPCRYEHLKFERGKQHMDGETALKFVRSRHGTNGEGSDFARSKRQEKVIKAFREKIFSAQTFLNPVRLISLYDVFKGSIDTDIMPNEIDDFIKLARELEDAPLNTQVLDAGGEEGRPGLLINPPISSEYKYQWVIIPRAGAEDYSEIHQYVDCEIKVGECTVTPTRPARNGQIIE
jgi:polyisoprenyl-teichoic acid--peptidoglycan teichoic acid transferase